MGGNKIRFNRPERINKTAILINGGVNVVNESTKNKIIRAIRANQNGRTIKQLAQEINISTDKLKRLLYKKQLHFNDLLLYKHWLESVIKSTKQQR